MSELPSPGMQRGSCPFLLVLADSLAFHGPRRAEPADEPRLWPNVAAGHSAAEPRSSRGLAGRHGTRGTR